MAYDRYGNYSPSQAFFGSLGTGLSDILGGYVGEKIEQDKLKKQQVSTRKILKANFPDLSDEQLSNLDQVPMNALPSVMNTLRTNQNTQRDQESGGLLAERLGVDPGQMEGLTPGDQRTFLNQQYQQNQQQRGAQDIAGMFGETLPEGSNITGDQFLRAQQILRPHKMTGLTREEQQKRTEIADQLIAQGYSRSQVQKLEKWGTQDIKAFEEKRMPKGLTTTLQNIRHLKNQVVSGKISMEKVREALLPDVQQEIMEGVPFSTSGQDQKTVFFRDEALKRLNQSERFQRLKPKEKSKKLQKLSRKYAEEFGYTFIPIKKPKKKVQAAPLTELPPIQGYPQFTQQGLV